MQRSRLSVPIFLVGGLLAVSTLGGCHSPSTAANPETLSAATQAPVPPEKGGQDMYGPYEVVENWLQPLA